MDKPVRIAYRAISLTSRHPRWWLLALLQAAAFSVIGQMSKPKMLDTPLVLLLFAAAICLSPLTVGLWRSIKAQKDSAQEQARAGVPFISQMLNGLALILLTVVLIVLARILFPFWPIHTLVFAIAASSAGLALLYIVLYGQNLTAALRLTAYTWNTKLSFGALAVLVLLVAHGISFALVHGVWGNVYFFREFSIPSHSVTIWLLSSLLLLLIGYISAILNCFVVLMFLEYIGRKKDPEEVKQAITLAVPEASIP